MNTVHNGKGDRPRNNWGPKWYTGFAAINWHHSNDRADEGTTGRASKASEPNDISPTAVTCESSQH